MQNFYLLLGSIGHRGKPGKAGAAGKAGIPGLSAWIVEGKKVNTLLIPSSIAVVTYDTRGLQPHLSLQEGENLRLECTVAGKPTPKVSWMKKDGSPISMGSWKGKI